MKKTVPEFRTEEEEFEFWSETDSTEYLDWSDAERIKLPNLQPTQPNLKSRIGPRKRA